MKRTLTGVVAIALVTVSGVSLSRLHNSGASRPELSGDSRHLVFKDENNVAIRGYDVVSYFMDNKPAEGNPQYSSRWHDATWHFASAENLAKFENDPSKYAPQYGGYCAWGVGAKNDLFEIDPTAWKIVDAKLYLNFDSSVQKSWLADVPRFIDAANSNWPGLVSQQTR